MSSTELFQYPCRRLETSTVTTPGQQAVTAGTSYSSNLDLRVDVIEEGCQGVLHRSRSFHQQFQLGLHLTLHQMTSSKGRADQA